MKCYLNVCYEPYVIIKLIANDWRSCVSVQKSVTEKLTSSLDKALRSALYSMLTSALPPPVDLYVYLDVLVVTADDDIFEILFRNFH